MSNITQVKDGYIALIPAWQKGREDGKGTYLVSGIPLWQVVHFTNGGSCPGSHLYESYEEAELLYKSRVKEATRTVPDIDDPEGWEPQEEPPHD